MRIIYESIYFIFPLLFAGLIHHLVIIKYNLLSSISKPIDNNKYYKSKPLFGKNKTWRGIIVVPVLSGFGSLIIAQTITIPMLMPSFLVGLLLGVGYVIAELPNSFIKRRFEIKPGEKHLGGLNVIFITIDQIDSVAGSIIVMLFIYPASILLCVFVFIIGGLLHLLVDLYLYKHGYKRLRNNQNQS